MPAGVDILRYTGVSPGVTVAVTGRNTRANAYDTDSTGDTTSPIQIPSSGTNYSFWVSTRLSVTGALPTTGISNIRWYSNGTNNFNTPGGTGIDCYGGTAAAYTQATGTVGQTGNQLTTSSYVGISTVQQVWISTAASPLAISGAAGVAAGPFGNFFVYQINVGISALPGTSGTTTFTWKYDED